MVFRLHKRDAAKGDVPRGLSCDEDGVFFARDCVLVAREVAGGRTLYRCRPLEEINKTLSAGYGVQINVARHEATLERIAALMTAGEWGLAQIMTLQLAWPELAEDDAVEHLQKASDLLRFNPNHKPPGPGGGQFTSDDGGGDGSGEIPGPKAQPRGMRSVPRLSYRTTSGGPNTANWGTLFELSHPSKSGGFIIQKIDTTYVIDSKTKVTTPTFWEAWPVKPNSRHTGFAGTGAVGGGDDFWGGEVGLEGSHGIQIDTGSARFYEGLTESELRRRGFAKGNAGPAGGDSQMNTLVDPKLPTDNASNVVFRISRQKF